MDSCNIMTAVVARFFRFIITVSMSTCGANVLTNSIVRITESFMFRSFFPSYPFHKSRDRFVDTSTNRMYFWSGKISSQPPNRQISWAVCKDRHIGISWQRPKAAFGWMNTYYIYWWTSLLATVKVAPWRVDMESTDIRTYQNLVTYRSEHDLPTLQLCTLQLCMHDVGIENLVLVVFFNGACVS